MDEVRAHLMAEHGFTLQCEGSVLYGLCRHCAQNAAPSAAEEQPTKKCACCVDTDAGSHAENEARRTPVSRSLNLRAQQ